VSLSCFCAGWQWQWQWLNVSIFVNFGNFGHLSSLEVAVAVWQCGGGSGF
jgi:hypothetical protein